MPRLQFIGQRLDDRYRQVTIWSESVEVETLDASTVVAVFEGLLAKHGEAPEYKVYGLDPKHPNVARILK